WAPSNNAPALPKGGPDLFLSLASVGQSLLMAHQLFVSPLPVAAGLQGVPLAVSTLLCLVFARQSLRSFAGDAGSVKLTRRLAWIVALGLPILGAIAFRPQGSGIAGPWENWAISAFLIAALLANSPRASIRALQLHGVIALVATIFTLGCLFAPRPSGLRIYA